MFFSRPLTPFLLSLLLLAATTQASTIEDATGEEVSYQFDAGTQHDAPDSCAAASPTWSVAVPGSTNGLLAPPDDATDFIAFDVPTSLVGTRLTVRVAEGTAAPNADLMVFAPNCSTVFAPENIPTPFPLPPLPLSTEEQHTLGNIGTTWTCDPQGWSFKLQMQGFTPPDSIHVAWSDGTEQTVNQTKHSLGVTWYDTTNSLAYIPTDAWANVPIGSNGKFLIDTGPCTAVDAGAVYGDPPVAGDDVIAFTPIEAGQHAMRITISDDAPQAPRSMTMTCHYCLGPSTADQSRSAGYRVSVA